jgi:S-adenosylmethionine:tRNA ribosyltransferase-isomerase
MQTADFDFELPPALIAQNPAAKRDESRLLVLHRALSSARFGSSGNNEVRSWLEHSRFAEIQNFFGHGDILVLNDSRVIPARLRARNLRTKGSFEVLLLEETGPNEWWVMARPGKRALVGTELYFMDRAKRPTEIKATVTDVNTAGHRKLLFEGTQNIFDCLSQIGEIPLPPYIRRGRGETSNYEVDQERYQTIYAAKNGSVAAPTAGLHFTHELLSALREKGVRICFVTLHVGPGTFAPVKTENLFEHHMHEEQFELPSETVNEIEAARKENRRVVAVGTTTLRVLESVASNNSGHLVPGSGRTRIFIFPPYSFRVVDALVTNFHLPCSTLLMLVSAFASPRMDSGRELILAAYAEAIREQYRFFSYGDAMLIL